MFATGGALHAVSPRLHLRLFDLWGESLSPKKFTVKAAGLYAIRGPNKLRELTGPEERGLFSSPNDTWVNFIFLNQASSDTRCLATLFDLFLSAVLFVFIYFDV